MTEKSTQYDNIGGSYDEYTRISTLKRAERHTLLRMAGSVGGKSILDLACGTGYYSRLLKQCGAAKVVGVDISPEMIRLAEQEEAGKSLGIEYHVRDAVNSGPLGQFDVVTAAYLLNYAASRDELAGMCRAAYDNLAPGGRLLAFTANPEYDLASTDQGKYGARALSMQPDGDRHICRLEFMTNPPTPFTYYQWCREAYEQALRAAGFATVRWQRIEASPEDVDAYGEEFWRDLHDNCLSIGLDCTK